MIPDDFYIKISVYVAYDSKKGLEVELFLWSRSDLVSEVLK